MTNYDIERIEKFMDLFELSTDDIFAFIGVGVCRMAINRTLSGSGDDDPMIQNLQNMDAYIFNDLKANKEIPFE